MNDYKTKRVLHIEPYSLCRDILLNLWVVILAALIGLMAVNIWNHSVHTPLYTSTATLIVNIRNSAAYSYTNLSSSSEMAKIFTEVFKQSTMKQYAASHLGASQFEGSVSSSVLDNTNIFTVSVTTSSPETSYEQLCAILEVYPQISEAVFSDSVIDVMRSPNLPSSPSNTISGQYKTLAILGCGAAVLALIVYLSVTRDTVKDEYTFRQQIDAKLFGTVVYESTKLQRRRFFGREKFSHLITNPGSSHMFTENFRKIANRLEYLNRTEGAKVFLVTSFAENEGKSTTIANMALALAERGNRVALLDMDFKKPAIHKIFEIGPDGTPDFASLLIGEISVKDYRFREYKHTGVHLAVNTKNHSNYVNWIYEDRVSAVFDALRTDAGFDYILIDTPPLSAAADVTTFMRFADKSFVVVRTDCVYTADINDGILSLKEKTDTFAGCILNSVHREFSFLGQLGFDETGNYGRGTDHGRYSRYSD